MFSIGEINFINGAYSGNRLNGAEAMIMESAEKVDNVINDFEKAFQAGMDPNNVLNQILIKRNYYKNDFLDSDIKKITRKVESIVNNNRSYR